MMGNDLAVVEISRRTERASAGETLRAKPLGGALYELRNPPKLFPELNCGDVMRAVVPDTADTKPSVQEVVGRGGHSTSRLIFTRGTLEHKIGEVLSALRDQGFSPEPGGQRMYVVDAGTAVEYRRVQEYLTPWEGVGRLRLAAAKSVGELIAELESY